ncbi:MAG: hypothetical protein COV29_03740 [Candidatus Yanofskybacteria bacterium CG10_big_fil_rev_8_21_14_0_10_36_16]|uniref:Beta-glucosidase n=1 Tax=Candidatus Yanofskybacteria bacterium CG10_big_fil_rev_8_21_14_0_10_36_16 TaxID=1975096 RepID=A0A2J0Q9A8_9BACT|nr:MAG: hypothetical protein COV29_03740 [Candidatus Yanofskybacteria bacterium CG10_big_fil_rev_8_21_14_0_10_36_16]
MAFPKNFLWGSSTSSHQVEGGNFNNWSVWEKSESRIKNLESRIKEPGFKNQFPPYVFDKWPSPSDIENYISGKSADHYNRFQEDFDIAKSLGHTCHRLSIEWSRIEPKEGEFDEKEIKHYQQVVSALKERGIEPFITIWHWTLPLWLRDKGGLLAKDFPEHFARYSEKIVKPLSKLGVKFWITINEPNVITGASYLKGQWPPQKKNYFAYNKALKNLIYAHKKSYSAIKKIDASLNVGIAKNQIFAEAKGFFNKIIKHLFNQYWNFNFLNKIKNHQDFIGLNHYFHKTIGGNNKNEKTSDMRWELYPKAMYSVLKDLEKYNKPVYITENGLADMRDKHREWFIKESLKNIHQAIEEGIDVRGYMHWSLLDNFEWDKGFWPRFGLVEIDHKTLERTIRPSAYKFSEIIKQNDL